MSYEAISMVKLVKVIRQEILEWGLFDFSGTFQMYCQANSVLNTLKILISMLLNGHNVQHQDISESQACLTLSQLIFFHVKSKLHTTEKKTAF